MSRIGLIREAILKHGGRRVQYVNHHYYVDGPNSLRQGFNVKDGGVRYKVDRRYDGLDEKQRKAVAAELNNHPEVLKAYISKKLNYRSYFGSQGEHLVVLFAGKTKQAKKAMETLQRGNAYRRMS